ncbi:MAG: 2-phosphosulfolactate phosphatase [Fervidobacterium sp.]|uniref:2-phosphosulfolactate phosphatase n=1 Tax=Fervidobacterium sp. TaxID=1871331 RepID=UPI004048FC88
MLKTFLTHNELDSASSTFQASIVIDVLRATSTIVTALSNGARFVIPVEKVEEAVDIKMVQPDLILSGERNGIKPQGFELGNSPLEYSKQVVNGKGIVLTTSNGTKAIQKAKKIAENVYIAAFLNISYVVEQLSAHENIAIICAGNESEVSYEDTQLAGFIISKLLERKSYSLSDSSLIALRTWEAIKKPDFSGTHSQKLIELGFGRDVEFCQNIDISPIVPICSSEKIVSMLIK